MLKLSIALIYVVFIVGWIFNIIKLIHMSGILSGAGSEQIIFILRIMGVFMPPLGAFMGYFI